MLEIPPPPVQPLRVENGRVRIIDQTLLPAEEIWITLASVEDVWEAIRALRIRGAPAIGIAAAYGMAIAAGASTADDRDDFLSDLSTARDYLKTSRPTAVNLAWAVERVYRRITANPSSDSAALRETVWTEAAAIMAEDLETCRRIGEAGAQLVGGGNVLTHCNTGGLATAGYGTALSAIYMAHMQGMPVHVYVDETRPLLQGARLTAWELLKAGIDATLITDSTAASVLARGDVRSVIVGADRIAANGDTANKIGTLGLAVLANAFEVPFYVAAPLSTIDFQTPNGAGIPIEERAPDEVSGFAGQSVTPLGVRVHNPAFDITPARYITALITEHGVIEPPFEEGLARYRPGA
jgi:methylthioribose-1-phosphate isomerase